MIMWVIMGDELCTPETDREYELCWRILHSVPDHTTKAELRHQMSEAIREQRALCRQLALKGWSRHDH